MIVDDSQSECMIVGGQMEARASTIMDYRRRLSLTIMGRLTKA